LKTKSILIILISILFLVEPIRNESPNNRQLIVYLIIFMIGTISHIFSLKNKKNWFRLDLIFILGFAIVHFQWPLMYSYSDINPSEFSFNSFWANSTYLNYMNFGTWLSTVGILFWYLGFSLFKEVDIQKISLPIFDYKILYYLTFVFFILFILTAGQDYLTGAVYKGHSNTAKGSGLSIYFNLIFSLSIIVITAIAILNSRESKLSGFIKGILKIDKKYLIILSCVVLFFLIVGDRGGALQPAFAFLILYGTFIKPIDGKKFFLLIICGGIIMTLVGIGRADSSGNNALSTGLNNATISVGYDITVELANSARTLYKSISYVPNHDDYFLGKLWVSHLLANIPLAQSFYLNLSDDKFYELDSAEYITYITRGKFSSWGEGSSLIADIYLNFGPVGVPIFMFLLGVFFKKIINEFSKQQNLYWIIAGAILASYAFYLGRGGLFYPLRPIIWSIILYIIFIKRKIS
jgi:oligosaccharide repeat unit polymerase